MTEKLKAIRSLPSIEGSISTWTLLKYNIAECAKAQIRIAMKRRQLAALLERPAIKEASIVALLLVKDEQMRLDFLLHYYRRMGVQHFIVIDNESKDGTLDYLMNQADVSVFVARGEYRRARFGNDWVNYILSRYCVGKWVLWIDADEYLVFSRTSKNASLSDLVSKLELCGQESLQVLMLDLYSRNGVNENIVAPGNDPLDVCDLYDRSGYISQNDALSGTTWIRGGVRGRIFFPESKPEEGPVLNKTPLVKWRRGYAFLKSSHQLWPRRLNGSGRVEGVLLHFKFTEASAKKMLDPDVLVQHTDEYLAYTDVANVSFAGELTARYTSGQQLADNGLFSPKL